jgi:hypothetical protein
MASRRARQRAQARPWKQPQPEPAIDWAALAADLKRRETNPSTAGRT